MNKILMSACLAGFNCKYSGKNNQIEDERITSLLKSGKVILCCPEFEGGLPIPRDPAEIVNGRVVTSSKEDVTIPYEKGAYTALKKALLYQISIALLKESSPSCGKNSIYDGSFSGIKIPGSGLTASLLQAHDIAIFSEKELPQFFAKLSEEEK